VKGRHSIRDKKSLALSLTQDDCTSLQEYYSRKVALLTEVCKDSGMALDIFVDGLKPELKAWVLAQPPSVVDSGVELVDPINIGV